MSDREAVCEMGNIIAAGSNLVDEADKPDSDSDYPLFFHDSFCLM